VKSVLCHTVATVPHFVSLTPQLVRRQARTDFRFASCARNSSRKSECRSLSNWLWMTHSNADDVGGIQRRLNAHLAEFCPRNSSNAGQQNKPPYSRTLCAPAILNVFAESGIAARHRSKWRLARKLKRTFSRSSRCPLRLPPISTIVAWSRRIS
jgi:hypothetical protein